MCCSGTTAEDLINDIYGEDLTAFPNATARAEFITERAILTPRNEDVDFINNTIMARDLTLPGQAAAKRMTYTSADTTRDEGHGQIFPTEFLNNLEFSGVPPHKLNLQVGCPIILLRSMTGGLANGTRLIVIDLQPRFIEAEVATGPLKGKRTFIPRLNITPSDTENWPFTLCRRQFPVRPAFAMSINKSQGQTFKRVGVYLPRPVFSHGQLYVALSRVGEEDAVKLLVPGLEKVDGSYYTSNVVYPEVLDRSR